MEIANSRQIQDHVVFVRAFTDVIKKKQGWLVDR